MSKDEGKDKNGVSHWVRTVLAASAVGAIVGASITAFVNVSLQSRSAVESDFTQFKTVSTDLFELLSEYSKQATGNGVLPADISEKLNRDMLALFKVGKSISVRNPSLKPDFDTYEQKLLALKKAADGFSGPIDAKSFVEATSAYLDAEDEFKQRVSSEQSGILSLL
jgi:hypothetical protein